ncbi:MAG: hypothetical protein E7294_12355 [Lachnospiraceae bacterium]|nr:hypothetical protein [Lachnospiraceae bacterium]
MRQVMAVCDCEKQYAFRLAEYMNRQKSLPFEVMAFDDLQKLETYLQTQEIMVLLIEEGLFFAAKTELTIPQIVLLKSGQNEKEMDTVCEKMDYQVHPVIYKYQSAKIISRQLLEICMESSQIRLLPTLQTNSDKTLIAVYSPVGRCLQTSFSIVLGQLLAKDRKCLYINMEPYSGFHSLFGKQYEQGMSDLLYYLSKGNERFLLKLKGMAESIGQLDYIPPACSFLDLMDISIEIWQLFIETLVEQTDYDVILFDLSDHIRGLFEILSACDHIYTIIKKDGIAMAKLDQYEQILSYTNHEAILDKTKKCQIPVFKELPRQLERLPYSELAEYVRQLIREDGL